MRMKYDDAMGYYGSDKPDLRFDMKISDLTDTLKDTEFSVFREVLESNGIINCLVGKNCAEQFSRKEIDKLTEFVKTYKANGLFYLKFENEVSGSIAKNISEKELNNLKEKLNIENGDIVKYLKLKINFKRLNMNIEIKVEAAAPVIP